MTSRQKVRLGLFAILAYGVSGEVSDYGIPSRVLLAAASAIDDGDR